MEQFLVHPNEWSLDIPVLAAAPAFVAIAQGGPRKDFIYARLGGFPVMLVPYLDALKAWVLGLAVNVGLQLSLCGGVLWSMLFVKLFLMALLGYLSKSAYPLVAGRCQVLDAIEYFSGNYQAATQFKREAQSGGVVLSDKSPVYLNALLPAEFALAPIDDNNSYSRSAFWHYGIGDALRLWRAELDAGHTVYALQRNRTKAHETLPRLPAVEGAGWARMDIRPDTAAVWRLERRQVSD